MRNFNFKTSILFLGFFYGASAALATPVLYKGGTMLKTMVHSDYNYLNASYSLTSYYALGATFEEFKSSDGTDSDTYYYAQNNFLVKRFFQDDSQGNIYAKFGAGYREIDKKLAYFGGLQGDWETRTFYSAVYSDMLATNDEITHLNTALRIGISPYEAKYDEMQAWMMLQVEHSRHEDKEFSITPMMRFFHKTAYWEIGSDLDGHWKMHFMIHL